MIIEIARLISLVSMSDDVGEDHHAKQVGPDIHRFIMKHE